MKADADREYPVFETEIRVRYAETDRMGVVYYGNYFTWFEVARGDVLRKIGYPYSALEEDGIFLPVTEAHSKYLAPVRYDDLITVATKIEGFGSASISFSYEIRSGEARKLCTKGATTHAFVGRGGRLIKCDGNEKIETLKKLLSEYVPPAGN